MRLPLKGADNAARKINGATEKVQQEYLQAMGPLTRMQSVSAMLGDGTVTQTNTFDPASVKAFYQKISSSLEAAGWSRSELSISNTDDLRRIFLQANKAVGKYYLAAYFGVQYHALPYYKVDKRVIEIQKELARLADEAGAVFGAMSGAADKALQAELERRRYGKLEFSELFAKMFEDEELVRELDTKAASVERQFSRYEEIRNRKASLFDELSDLLIETYQTSCVLIDQNRQMQGEEGVTVYFDLETIQNKKTKSREPYIDSTRITSEWTDRLAQELESVERAIKEASVTG